MKGKSFLGGHQCDFTTSPDDLQSEPTGMKTAKQILDCGKMIFEYFSCYQL